MSIQIFTDVQNSVQVGGKHSKYRFGVDDYCMAAINLYMDIVQLFLYLLQILGHLEHLWIWEVMETWGFDLGSFLVFIDVH